jgi:aspartyl-tRNA synthetase
MRIQVKHTVDKVGEEVTVAGWVHARRDMGKVAFFDIRDASGLLQVVAVPSDLGDDGMEIASSLRDEWVVEFTGIVQARGERQINENMVTGTVELLAKSVRVLNEAKTPPFEVSKDSHDINEEVRLKHRYLDLRTERLQKNIRMRSQMVRSVRDYLYKKEFVEIETPYLTKATPEGSRDFVVPSRLQPGKFFALPQSPQQYKQLLMVGGMERYFQIARCFRDEDPRADRGFEHSQIDIEMSFASQEDILNLVEEMMIETAESMGMTIKEKPFPRITYKESMEKYGDDKFDLRTEEEKEAGNVLAYAWVIDFPMFEKNDDGSWTFSHNPFSMPQEQHLAQHMKGENVGEILAQQYDLVCNGYEAGGGSIRAHDPDVLRATYKTLGYSEEETEESVGHMISAFEYGAPPHGGIALGVERNLMNFTGETSLRETQAFPMTGRATTSVMDAPSSLAFETLHELHLSIDAEDDSE